MASPPERWKFEEKLENLKAALSLHFAWYSFCRIHSPLRVMPGMQAVYRPVLGNSQNSGVLSMRRIKTVVLWFVCLMWGLFLIRFVLRFRLVSPLSGTGMAAHLGSALGSIIGLFIAIVIFIVLLKSALASTKAK
jgi:hypothetical protein